MISEFEAGEKLTKATSPLPPSWSVFPTTYTLIVAELIVDPFGIPDTEKIIPPREMPKY